MESILQSVKKVIGISGEYDVFDVDILMHINSFFGSLNQMGIGPEEPFVVSTGEEVWSDFIQDKKTIEMVRSYISLRARLVFDPPSNSITSEALRETIKELEWRMHFDAEVRRGEN